MSESISKVDDIMFCYTFLVVLKDDLDNDEEKFMDRIAQLLSDSNDTEKRLQTEVARLKEEVRDLKYPNNGGGPA